jgi:hypothetical protein
LDAGNAEIEEDLSLRVFIIRLTASSSLEFALEGEFIKSAVSSR